MKLKSVLYAAVLAGTVVLGAILAYPLFKPSGKTPQQYFETGKKYFEEGKFSEARIELLNAMKTDPVNRDSRYYLALTYVGENNIAGAVRELKAIVEIHPDDVQANLRLGNIYLTEGQSNPDLYRESRKIAQEILLKQPENVEALILSGSAS